uniref:Defensin-like protein n=1 Tax=Vigna nakashimae TaxID=157749 RepID=A9UKM7_9FABA|nr:defensin-like protein [Vigna nakashimae]
MERKTFSFLFLLLLVLASDVAVERGEAKTCTTKNEEWAGRCIDYEGTCQTWCRNGGYQGGWCRGPRSCYCLVNC